MKSQLRLEIKNAFSAFPEPLRKIHDLLGSQIGKTTIKAECIDNVTRKFDNISELLKYENPKTKRIISLQLQAYSDDFKKQAEVEFIDESYFCGIKINIEAKDDLVTLLRSNLLDITSSLRPWYYVVNKINVYYISIILYVPFILGTIAVILPSIEDLEPSIQLSLAGWLTLLLISSLYFISAYLIQRFRALIFPSSTFLIGQEVQRIDILDKWRWGGVIAFLVSLAAGIALFLLQ